MDEKKKYLTGEIIRFIITGVIATLVDFLVSYLVASFLPDSIGVWKEVIYTAAGFIVSLVINYFLSAYWVYKNVDKSVDKKSFKNIALFVGLSCVGLALGIGIMIGFKAIDTHALHSNFEDWLKFIVDNKNYSFSAKSFWWAILFFGFKTLVVLAWNYLSRKFFIFKSPKEENN
ncbi:MAG: GtrA family protein [Bacilli bacterium]|nr:GtrA family protein [Bacilli bacterium]